MVWQLLISLLFPHRCSGCNKLFTLLCEDCRQCIDFTCFPLKKLQQHIGCDSLYALSFYSYPIKQLLQDMKYRGVKDCCVVASSLLYHGAHREKVDLVTAAPMHWKRLRHRGFNQAEVIAKDLAQKIHVPYMQLLAKNKHTPQQAHLSRKKRSNNLDSSIVGQNTAQIRGKRILLIDDVVTTGSTLRSCTQALKKHSAAEVHALVVAHE